MTLLGMKGNYYDQLLFSPNCVGMKTFQKEMLLKKDFSF
jgi:hypothetical protein